jgi:hypothetical protein
MGIESDTGFFKFGDGVTEWRELRYALSRATVEVDKELETEGQAADAKATGERLEYLEAYVYEKKGGLKGSLVFDELKINDEQSVKCNDKSAISAEIGENYLQATLKWNMQDIPKSAVLYVPGSSDPISLVDEEGNPDTNGTYIYEEPIDGLNKTEWIWKLELINPFNKKETATASIKFYRYLYYGAYKPQEEITSNLIGSKSKIVLQNPISTKVTIPQGEQPFIAVPKTFGVPKIAILDTGASGAMIPQFVKEIELPNYSDQAKISYYVWSFSGPPNQIENWNLTIEKEKEV